MSYILDALKKSEEERQRGEIPNLQTVQANPASKLEKKSFWPHVLMLAFLLNAGLFLWWLHPWESNPVSSTPPAAAPPQTARNVERPETGEKPVPASVPVPAKDATKNGRIEGSDGETPSRSGVQTAAVAPPPLEKPAVRLLEKHEAGPSGDTARAVPKPEPQSRPPKALGPNPSTARQDVTPQSAARAASKEENPNNPEGPAKAASALSASSPAVPGGPGEKAPRRGVERAAALPPKSVAEKPAAHGYPKELLEALLNAQDKSASPPAPPLPEPKTAAQLPSAEKGPKHGVPTLRDLPLDVQLKVPKMSFSVFVYAQKPADRMVIIDGRTRREGDEISPGLKLEEITQEGAIFSFKGHRFLQRVF